MNASRCPKCDQPLDRVIVERVEGEISLTPKIPLVSYACKACSVVISVGPDPDALKRELREIIRQQIQRDGGPIIV